MRIRALSVFEGVVYHCMAVDTDNPCRPTLEVDALLRPGDADATSGPLLLGVADYIVMVGGLATAQPCLHELDAAGRIIDHLGVDHITFPTWTPVSPPAGATSPGDHDEPGTTGTTGDDGADGSEPDDGPPPLRVVDDD